MAMEPDEPRKTTTVHEIGQKLDHLSVDDLAARIAQLEAEIARLRADMEGKRASKAAADLFFKR